MAFVHLHNHTEYSLLDGATHIKDMVARAKELGMPAVAITDHGVMSGVPELAEACDACKDENGNYIVKPIYGCEVYFTTDEELRRDVKPKLYHMILLAKTNEGYHNLVHLVSESHVDNFYYKPRTTFSQLQKYGHGLIGTSACVAGIIPRLIDNLQYDDALDWARKLSSCFDEGDFYIELQNQGIVTNGGMTQTQLNQELDKIAKQAGCKTIATNDFHYLKQEDARAQDVMMCIGMNKTIDEPGRMKFANDQFYMKTEEEMRAALADFPEACDNTVEVAEKCNVILERDSVLPNFPLPEGYNEEQYFRKQCEEGLLKRYGKGEAKTLADLPKEVVDRYEHEAGVIIQQGFPAYFLIVQEYIQWAKDNGIGVGPGRGSAAGSIVAYAMGITDLEPLENGLLFERFLSVERVEMPDIDVDFDDMHRQDVIDHVRDVYGEDHVAGVITFGTLKAKNAIRDAARVLGYSYGDGDRLSKMIDPGDLKATIKSTLETNSDFAAAYADEESIDHAIIEAARAIEGHVRGEGVHACATIICRDPMADHVPMKRDVKGGGMITQYDGHYTPDLGLLKMDFLGLRTLGVISRACNNIKERYGIEVKPDDIPLEDPKSFAIMGKDMDMDGLFQVESALYVSLFSRIPPRKFSDVVASIALNRPGPLGSGMVDDYVNRVSGKAEVKYYDDRLRPLLEETYGTIVYQEQLMQISMVMSGFSAGKADRLRKAMGKKKLDIMKQLESDWNEGAVENGYSLEVAKKIWSDAEKFAEYAFNKSHSAAYAVIVMRTAWLKAYYPTEFMAALLSSFMTSNDRLIQYIASCKHSGIPVLPPDINSSNLEFTPTDEGVRFGLAGVRGVGAAVADAIIAERKAGGPFSSLHDFVNRLDSKCYNRKTLEAFIKAGAFDSTGYTRRQLMHFVDDTPLLESAAKRQKDRAAGQVSMFDMMEDDSTSGFSEEIPAPDGIEWDRRQLLTFEKDILNIYVSDHPLSPYAEALSKVTKHSMAKLMTCDHDIKDATFAGMVTSVSMQRTRTNKLMAKFTLEDVTGHVECICFDSEKNAKKHGNAIEEDAIVKIKGKFEHGERGNQLIAYEVSRIDLNESAAKENVPRVLELRIDAHDFSQDNAGALTDILKAHPGGDRVVLFVAQSDGRKFRAELPTPVDATDRQMYAQLHELFGRPVWAAGKAS